MRATDFSQRGDKIATSWSGMSKSSGYLEGASMSTGRQFATFAGCLVLCAACLCPGFAAQSGAQPSQGQTASQPKSSQPKPRKSKKTAKAQKPPLQPLPSGPTGPVQQVPLDSMAPVAPQVSYQNSQLTINAPNSTLGDILRAVRKQTGAEIEIPPATERVVTHLGPGPAREVMAELLNGSRFNYVLLGSPADDSVLTRIVLVAKVTAPEANPNPAQMAEQQQPGMIQRSGNPGVGPEQEGNTMAAPDDAAEDAAADQAAAEAEQPAASPDQNAVKTPQQMLQEMQQRQLQMQQQQQMGQPPAGQGVPPQQPPPPQPQQ